MRQGYDSRSTSVENVPTPLPRSVPPVDPEAYAPTPRRPVRAKVRTLRASMRIEPHRHDWAQVAMSATGVIRMDTASSTYLVPPSRALWIPPGVVHKVTVVEDAEIRTLYVHPSARLPDDAGPLPCERWPECRVLEVSSLLREVAARLDTEAGESGPPTERERCLATLALDELRRAAPIRLGIERPADRRLRALCDAVIESPTRWATLDDWARGTGASPRTLARLFRSELGTSFAQWRQQVLLAHALSLAARRMPMASIAAELGYASPSAFTAMVRRTLGAPPTHIFSGRPGASPGAELHTLAA